MPGIQSQKKQRDETEREKLSTVHREETKKALMEAQGAGDPEEQRQMHRAKCMLVLSGSCAPI